MPHIIDKTFEFCYGHRVWSQQLDASYAEDSRCVCRHLHGHEGKVQVYLTADGLTRGMVTDFRHLTWLKKWIDQNIDHKFIIDASDPAFEAITGFRWASRPENDPPYLSDVVVECVTVAQTFDLDAWPSLPNYKRELLEGFLIVDFVPTSENLSKWLADIVQSKMKPLDVRVFQLDWWETPKSRSTYRPDIQINDGEELLRAFGVM